MYKTIKKKLIRMLLAGYLLAVSSGQAGCSLPKIERNSTLQTTVKLAEIVADEHKPRTRAEIIVNKLPVNSDIYVSGENSNNVDFYKLRAQILPLDYENFSIGVSGQHVDGTLFPAHQEVGLVMRLKGKPTKDSFIKSDIRYFPETNTIDTYTFLNTKKVFADIFGMYNTETENTILRPGIDYKINKNLSVGLEAMFSGEIKDLDKNYIGLRMGLKF